MPNPIIFYNPRLKILARKLRKQATPGEIAIWKRIRRKALGVEFHRQVPIGNYSVDFYCHELRLAVEVDGGSHDETTAKNDLTRQEKLEKRGLRFVRFTEHDAKHRTDEVVRILENVIESMR